MLENQVTNDVQKQFLRRTPIKLKQFARFLGDIAANEVDDLRIKALLSQVTKTRETCIEQGFDTTAKILNQLIKQLSMSRESLQSQKPLLIRLAKRLSEHAGKLSQGVKPQKKALKSNSSTKKLKNKPKETPTTKPELESEIIIKDLQTVSDLQTEEIVETIELSSEVPFSESDFTEETLLDLSNINEDLKLPMESEFETNETGIDESRVDESDINDSLDEADEFDYLKLYDDKSNFIFLTSTDFKTPQELDHYPAIISQLKLIGITCFRENTLIECVEKSNQLDNCIIIAPLDAGEELKVLEDDVIETKKTPLVFVANEDSQENRLKAIRNQGTGFVVAPLSLATLFDQVELSFDLNFETPCRILVMEDSKAQSKYYEKVLQKGHFDIRVVNEPEILLEAIRGFDPETILMDMQMPNSSGIELTQMIRQMPCYAHLPIIFLSAEESLRKQNQTLISGGTAFIVKPVQKEQLMFMARLYSLKFRLLKPKIDINPDTNLAYPNKFKQMMASEIARVSRTNTRSVLVLIQIDEIESLIQSAHFSFINNAINQLTQVLKKRLRQTDVIGHIDANHLGVILTSGDKNYWNQVMLTIQEQFSNLNFNLDQQPKYLSVSMGISEVESNFNAYQWLERSQQALEEAIQKGSSQINWNN